MILKIYTLLLLFYSKITTCLLYQLAKGTAVCCLQLLSVSAVVQCFCACQHKICGLNHHHRCPPPHQTMHGGDYHYRRGSEWSSYNLVVHSHFLTSSHKSFQSTSNLSGSLLFLLERLFSNGSIATSSST